MSAPHIKAAGMRALRSGMRFLADLREYVRAINTLPSDEAFADEVWGLYNRVVKDAGLSKESVPIGARNAEMAMLRAVRRFINGTHDAAKGDYAEYWKLMLGVVERAIELGGIDAVNAEMQAQSKAAQADHDAFMAKMDTDKQRFNKMAEGTSQEIAILAATAAMPSRGPRGKA